MKIRSGFVSNSSSSSFVIHRSYLDNETIEELKRLYDKGVENKEIYDDAGEYFYVEKNYISFSGYDGLDKIFDLLKQKDVDKDKICQTEG